jgi:hypothetical protein
VLTARTINDVFFRNKREDVHPGSSVGSVASAEEKHSTSESPDSDDPRKAPRASQRTPRSPKQPNSTLVEIGFRSRHRPNPILASSQSIKYRLESHENIQCEHDEQTSTAHKDGEGDEVGCKRVSILQRNKDSIRTEVRR